MTSWEQVTGMTGMSDDGVMGLPRVVRAADVPALIAAYGQAQHAELVVGWLLARASRRASPNRWRK